MKKKVILFLIFPVLFFVSCMSSGDYDTRAVESLDKLTETIGKLTSCSYTVYSFDSDDKGEEIFRTSDVYLRESNKMFISNTGTKGEMNYWYNGTKFSYFLFNKNEYDILNAPDHTLTVIDSLHSIYDLYFPAADFLNPTLTDDMLENYDQILFFGDEKVDDVNCDLIEASNKSQVVQIWIDKESHLPHKMVINYNDIENEYYEAKYTNWILNPKLPDIMFEFQPPKGAIRKEFKVKN